MRGLGLGITGSGFHPAIVRAHCRAMALSSISGNRRRNSTAADNSPSRSKMSRMAAASSSVTTNIPIEWDGRAKSTRKQPKSGDRRHSPPVMYCTISLTQSESTRPPAQKSQESWVILSPDTKLAFFADGAPSPRFQLPHRTELTPWRTPPRQCDAGRSAARTRHLCRFRPRTHPAPPAIAALPRRSDHGRSR